MQGLWAEIDELKQELQQEQERQQEQQHEPQQQEQPGGKEAREHSELDERQSPLFPRSNPPPALEGWPQWLKDWQKGIPLQPEALSQPQPNSREEEEELFSAPPCGGPHAVRSPQEKVQARSSTFQMNQLQMQEQQEQATAFRRQQQLRHQQQQHLQRGGMIGFTIPPLSGPKIPSYSIAPTPRLPPTVAYNVRGGHPVLGPAMLPCISIPSTTSPPTSQPSNFPDSSPRVPALRANAGKRANGHEPVASGSLQVGRVCVCNCVCVYVCVQAGMRLRVCAPLCVFEYGCVHWGGCGCLRTVRQKK